MPEPGPVSESAARPTLEADLSPAEIELPRELVASLRGLRYGSVGLTVHDGHVVEIQKVEKIRKVFPGGKE